jgi:hypothetical protein
MPRQNGKYTLPAPYPFQNGTTADATAVNSVLSDMATGISGSLPADGSAPWTGPQNANSQRLTNLAPGTASTDAATVGQIQAFGLPFRNGLINGDFTIAQRVLPATIANASSFIHDRWKVATGASASATASLTSVRDGGLTLQRTASGSTDMVISQKIENVENYAGQTVTVSFDVSIDVGGPITPTLVQNFGTGGSPSADVTTAGSPINVGASVQRYTQQFNVPDISSKTIGTNNDDGLVLQLAVPASTGNCTVSLNNVQIEAGSNASSFEKVPPQLQLLLCQRYFIGGGFSEGGYMVTTGTVQRELGFPITMRAIPTMVTSASTQVNIASFSNNTNVQKSGFVLVANVNADDPYLLIGTYTASAEI